jgi:hypothetical protein
VWTIRHGRVVRFAAYIDTEAMLAALGAGEVAAGEGAIRREAL